MLVLHGFSVRFFCCSKSYNDNCQIVRRCDAMLIFHGFAVRFFYYSETCNDSSQKVVRCDTMQNYILYKNDKSVSF